jgi:hypothetical protein
VHVSCYKIRHSERPPASGSPTCGFSTVYTKPGGDGATYTVVQSTTRTDCSPAFMTAEVNPTTGSSDTILVAEESPLYEDAATSTPLLGHGQLWGQGGGGSGTADANVNVLEPRPGDYTCDTEAAGVSGVDSDGSTGYSGDPKTSRVWTSVRADSSASTNCGGMQLPRRILR